MARHPDPAGAREMFAEKTASLIGCVVERISYSDIHLWGGDRIWDYGI
ncbi:MAG: hypothetical protein ACT4QF_15775 [Sporichthyaceae bacterium]